MKQKLTAAGLLPGAAALLLVWGCPPAAPPGTECAAAAEACTTTDDCCEGLGCADGVCVGPTPCADQGEACADADDCCEGFVCAAGACVAPGAGNTAALPAKSIALDLVAIHDPDSDSYNGNCIACHGDRSDEVALDGVTPTAHATMQALFGEGNDRCIACHNGGPDFLTLSAGGLREQVDMSDVGCANCHGAGATPAFYAK